MKDSIIWVQGQIGKTLVYIAVTEPFFYTDVHFAAGKLLYSSTRPYGNNSVSISTPKGILFKVAYIRDGSSVIPVKDSRIQNVAKKIGLKQGEYFNANLNNLNNCEIDQILWPEQFLSAYSITESIVLAKEVANAYATAPESILLTGGLQLFKKSIEDAHDIDFVVPVDSVSQLDSINNFISSSTNRIVSEFNLRWPLRWYSQKHFLICPFFVYRGLISPILSLEAKSEIIDGSVIIDDDTYGIFNMPIYGTKGAVSLLAFRSTLVRGFLRNGMRIRFRCPMYRITEGLYKHERVAIVTDPWSEIENFYENVLNEWSC